MPLRAATKSFFVPEGAKWQRKRRMLGIGSLEEYNTFLQKLIQSKNYPSLASQSTREELIHSYVHETSRFEGEPSVFRTRQVIAVCMYISLHQKGQNAVWRACADNMKVSALNFRRLRAGVPKMYKISRLLASWGWGYRSEEIFLLFFISGRMCWDRINVAGFTRRLKEQKYVIGFSEQANRIPFSIPCIIKCILGNSIHLPDICSSIQCNELLATSAWTQYTSLVYIPIIEVTHYQELGHLFGGSAHVQDIEGFAYIQEDGRPQGIEYAEGEWVTPRITDLDQSIGRIPDSNYYTKPWEVVNITQLPQPSLLLAKGQMSIASLDEANCESLGPVIRSTRPV
ncbi:hypothetical protein P154DRAFT_540662 [Amniculicola lignicola CBS 123094]|uniref:Uncharacterized protein n=1 Tax=Amniculicola lignicola CBS 123094 TaxID=1392246 RepID=A0A6A5W685_9PLEO|nr:hypothetical protein P154DRAFT_540662 [Amniculicola lignicola CBS 123094]